MGLFKFKRAALIGLTTVLSASYSLFADATVDATFDDNQNDFGFYWYYYDDWAGVGPNDRHQVNPPGTPSVINVPYTDSLRHAFGDASDTAHIKVYTFKYTKDADGPYGTMPFTLGSTWTASYGDATPYVGLGTMLCKDGSWTDLTGAKTITFKARSHVGDLSVRFKIQTYQVDTFSNKPGSQLTGKEFGYYGTNVDVSKGVWTPISVDISTLALPGSWAQKIPFDITHCTKFAWEVGQGDNPTATVDTLDIKDLQIVGTYTFTPPDLWTKTETLGQYPAKGQFSTFDKAPKNMSKLGYYWYAYNDADIGGTSAVTNGASKDSVSNHLKLLFADGTGTAGSAAALEYQLGKSVMQGATEVKGFVGVGCNLYDSLGSVYWDAADSSVTSIYFEYYLMGDNKYLTLEVSDSNDVGDALHPTRKDGRGKGVVMYMNFPNTNGDWKAVNIPLSKLVYHDGWAGSKNIPLDLKALAKVQWKVQGGEGSAGKFAIDNVYFPDAPFTPDAVRNISHVMKLSAFNASFINGKININWKGRTALSNGRISLINARGAVVSSQSIAKTAAVSSCISSKNLSSGVYFVRFNAVDANGKSVVMQSPVSVIK